MELRLQRDKLFSPLSLKLAILISSTFPLAGPLRTLAVVATHNWLRPSFSSM